MRIEGIGIFRWFKISWVKAQCVTVIVCVTRRANSKYSTFFRWIKAYEKPH